MATLKDISALTHSSLTTISRVLSNDPTLKVTLETRNAILNAAHQLGYTAKHKWRDVPRERYTIGLVQWYSMEEELEDPYYSFIRLSVENECYRQGVNFVKYFKENLNEVGQQHVDGLICVGKHGDQEIERFTQATAAIVFIDFNPDPHRFSAILNDLSGATKTCLDYLVMRGHRSIGYLGGREYRGETHAIIKDVREVAFLEYMAAHPELHMVARDVHVSRFTTYSGYHMMCEVLAGKEYPTAFLCASDSIATGAQQALAQGAASLQHAVSIISINDIPAAQYAIPALTTIHLDTTLMGKLGVRLLLMNLEDDPIKPVCVLLPYTLVERYSVFDWKE